MSVFHQSKHIRSTRAIHPKQCSEKKNANPINQAQRSIKNTTKNQKKKHYWCVFHLPKKTQEGINQLQGLTPPQGQGCLIRFICFKASSVGVDVSPHRFGPFSTFLKRWENGVGPRFPAKGVTSVFHHFAAWKQRIYCQDFIGFGVHRGRTVWGAKRKPQDSCAWKFWKSPPGPPLLKTIVWGMFPKSGNTGCI